MHVFSDLGCCNCGALTPLDLPRCPAGHATCQDCMTARVRSTYTPGTKASRQPSLRIRCPLDGCDHAWSSVLRMGAPYSTDPALVSAFEEAAEASTLEVSGRQLTDNIIDDDSLALSFSAEYRTSPGAHWPWDIPLTTGCGASGVSAAWPGRDAPAGGGAPPPARLSAPELSRASAVRGL
jgi:hypothetical protein